MTSIPKPEILAPAGDPASFLAALAAGADAVYCGLKHFSARMLARNFSVSELARLAELARGKGRRTYVAVNVMVKPDEIEKAGRLVRRLVDQVAPEGLILQDIGMAKIARLAGFEGELHLSTLANVSHPMGLATAADLGFSRVVVPRELSVDEIRAMAEACGPGMSIEVFVHGALCHNVSGRCWWSSFMGGKSGLRGRCVQPCRRVYEHRGQEGRFFSCLDLSLDVLAKTLLPIPNISAWKIEGRKKGPHYVFHTVAAYKLLRDEPDDPAAKKAALDYLEQALGRTGTNYGFLPQRPKNPVDHRDRTGSGLAAGKLSRSEQGGFQLASRIPLLAGDLLRVGFEDAAGHQIIRISRSVPKGGRYSLRFEPGQRPESGTPVFLIDRRAPELARILENMEAELAAIPEKEAAPVEVEISPPKPYRPAKRAMPVALNVWRHPDLVKEKGTFGVWVSLSRAHNLPLGRAKTTWWWLPPVIWPNEESEFAGLVELLLSRGAERFVLNAPWQRALFPKDVKAILWAGPFCNIANPMALVALKSLGFSGAILSPELSGEDILSLPGKSPLPLGLVVDGAWPLGISRTISPEIKTCMALTSPKGEVCWAVRYDQNYFIYPNWRMDLFPHRDALIKAGYEMFLSLREPMPKEVPARDRQGLFNWETGLL
ncbi:peptidase U32 family protein [Desulfolutivibrio sulfoxidireducens]|uniref:peptidase U32 family protein n=1 Tax=Desulfolutivibrio sulfoxidireducens TaxID=2773299 RepID=UPI00159D9B11|nr:U32 family peptidase [Desulfolutivibrio sulfoxidireducens]QLA20685.1 U32 family peptidase [Desulfolutivibrio sulfoxidireducens]